MAVYELSTIAAKTICDQVYESGGELLDSVVQNAIQAITVKPLDSKTKIKSLDELGLTEDDDVILTLNLCKECDKEIMNCLPIITAAIDCGVINTNQLILKQSDLTATLFDTLNGVNNYRLVSVLSAGLPAETFDIVVRDIAQTTSGNRNNYSISFRADFENGVLVPSNVTDALRWSFTDETNDGNNDATFTITFPNVVNLKVIFENQDCCGC